VTGRQEEVVDRGSGINRREQREQDAGKGLRWRAPWQVEGARPDTGSGSQLLAPAQIQHWRNL